LAPELDPERSGESLLLLAEVDPKVGPEDSREKNRKAVAGLSLYLLGAKNGKEERMKQKPLASLAFLARTHFGAGNRVAPRTPRTPRSKARRMMRLHGSWWRVGLPCSWRGIWGRLMIDEF